METGSTDPDSHPGQLCRLCAHPQTDDKLTFIFSECDDTLDNLADIININLPVKVSQIDPLPKQICNICVEKLLATHEFALSCLAAEQEMQDLFADHKFRSNITGDTDSRDLPTSMAENFIKAESDVFLYGVESESQANLKENEVAFQCPLCCEGAMGSCVEKPAELNIQNKSPPTQSFEEELMIQHRRANEEDDSSPSVVEEDSSASDEEGGIGELDEFGTEQETDITDGAKDADEDYQPNPRKKAKRMRGKKKGRGRKRGRVSVPPRGRQKALVDPEENDALIWIKADNEQSIPLVQCIHCSGWLPGYASCLQHCLTSHLDINDMEQKMYHCARCEGVSVSSPSELIGHFKETHCPNHDLEVEVDNEQFIVTDKTPLNRLSAKDIARDITYFCSICEKGFSWLISLLRHTCSKLNSSDMYCPTCDQDYRNRQRFVFHMFFHNSKAPPLECDECGQSFADDSVLYDHVRFAHANENVECRECGKFFRSEKGLVTHQMTAHNTDPTALNKNKCSVCGKGYRDKQGLKEHLVTHMSEKPFPCDKCDRAYNRYSRLKQHQLSHVYMDAMECYECINCGLAFPDIDKALSHSTSEEHEVQSTVLNKVYRCEYCDTLFACADGLNQHRPSHVGGKPFVCHICGASFHTYSRVTTHKTTHGIYDQIEPQEGDFTIPRYFLCEHCGLSYPYWSYLQTHRKMRHSDNPYTVSCKLCPEKFKNSWSLVYHRKKVHEQNGDAKEWRKRSLQCPHCGINCMYQHTLSLHIERKHGSLRDEDDDGKRENYQCEECGKVFKYQSSLLLHQKLHQGQKNFQCEECNKTFLTIATLRNHNKRCHQGIKPHQCEYCGKAFFHKVSRDDHLRVHTGEKPFKCEFCEKSFRLKSMLTDHAKIHSDHRPYPCDVCGAAFRRMVHMKQHRMLHTGEKPFQCKFCGQDFRLKQELQRHMKTKHGEGAVDNVEEDEFIFAD